MTRVESDYILQPNPFSFMSKVLGEVLLFDGKRYMPSLNGNLETVALSPGGMFALGNMLYAS